MAGIEVNVSAPRLQPGTRRSRNHPRQELFRSVSHSPPSPKYSFSPWLANDAAIKSRRLWCCLVRNRRLTCQLLFSGPCAATTRVAEGESTGHEIPSI